VIDLEVGGRNFDRFLQTHLMVKFEISNLRASNSKNETFSSLECKRIRREKKNIASIGSICIHMVGSHWMKIDMLFFKRWRL